jgi:hypothetical protein
MDTAITISEQINNAREKSSLPILLTASEDAGGTKAFDHIFSQVVVITNNTSSSSTEPESESGAEDKNVTDFDDILIAEFEKIINADDNDSDLSSRQKILMDQFATHLHVVVSSSDDGFTCEVTVYYRYLDLDLIGPMIDGDLVIQGTSLHPEFGPSLCAIEYAPNTGSSFTQIFTIAASKMMMVPRTEGGEETKFVIPISVPSDYHEGLINVCIYANKLSEINYEDQFETPASQTDQLCAIKFCTSSQSGATKSGYQVVEETITEKDDVTAVAKSPSSPAEVKILSSIKIASDYDEIMAYHNEGYELDCCCVTADGIQMEQEHMWKSFIMAKYTTDASEQGVEDVTWVKCLKSLGALPSLMGYQVNTDCDLSGEDTKYSVFLAVKIGPHPLFRHLQNAMSSIDDEEMFKKYVRDQHATLRSAPTEMAQMLGGPCGLLLNTIDGATGPADAHLGLMLDTDEMLSDDEDNRSERSQLATEEEIVVDLRQRVLALRGEKSHLQTVNNELQKKASSLIVREKTLQGQTAAARTVADITSMEAPTASDVAANLPNTAGLEQTKENERQYSEELILIEEERGKLRKLNTEFDQLALDLQTRLDDKEFKANGICGSFKSFKREILVKAENSRTGHPIPKVDVENYAALEHKREEDLEKIRLKNISLRTTYRKLERSLRSREQLAEGLHMIDFEQLKIENQTLNEKIEERSEELTKLKRKKTLNVQILTHVREKLRFLEQANQVVKAELVELESNLVENRNSVTIAKLNRDSIRSENKELKAKQGFATSDLLLVDYEKRGTKVDEMRAKVSELKDRYQLLMNLVNKSAKNKTLTGSSRSMASMPPWPGPDGPWP